MLSISSMGAADPMLGFMPNLREGSDFRMTSQGVAIAMTSGVLAMFKAIQSATNKAANLFGMPGAIVVDGKIGPASGAAIKFTVGKFTDDLRGNLSPEARDGQTLGIAKDARNVLGTLIEAIERKSSAPIIATPISPTINPKPFVPSAAELVTTPSLKTSLPIAPALQPRFVSTTFDTKSRLSNAAWAGIVGAFLLAGIGAAVIVAKRD